MVTKNTGESETFPADSKKIAQNQNVHLNITKKRIFTKAKSSKEKTEKKQIETKTTKKKKNQTQKIQSKIDISWNKLCGVKLKMAIV